MGVLDFFSDLGDDLVSYVQTNFPWLADHLDRDTHIKDADDPYTIPSDEILTFRTSGKLVRLDVAIMAIHLMIARIYFRSLAHTTRLKVKTWARTIAEKASVFIAQKFTKEIVGKILTVIRLLGDLWEVESEQRAMEDSIRRASLKTQRELYQKCMGGTRKPRIRHSKMVWSRHPKK